MRKIIPVGYLVSIALFLSGIVYFFAANWPEFSRYEKLGLSIGVMLLFYIVSLLSLRFLSHQSFLGKWFLVAGAICYGLSISLIWQIYNSHADSYIIFLIWLVPSLLLAIITRYVPFSILSFILFHLAYWFYMNPSSYSINRSDFEEWSIYLIVAIINGVIFGVTFTRFIPQAIIRYLSYAMTHIMLIMLSIFEFFEPYSGWTNLVYISFALASYLLLSKKQVDKYLSIILFVMGSLYISSKIIEIPFLFGDYIGYLGLQIIGIICSIGIIIGGILLAKHLTKKHTSTTLGHALKGILIVIVTLIGSIMFASSFGGLLFFLFESVYASVVISLCFIIIGISIKKLGPYAQNTLVMIGFFTGLLESFFLSSIITISFMILSIAVLILVKDGVIRFISYSTIIGCAINLLFDDLRLGDHVELIFILFAIVNFLVSLLYRATKDIQRISLVFGLFFFYGLTFLENTLWVDVLYSLLFFVITTCLFLYFARQENIFNYRMTIIFWFSLLISTYYDLVWSLLHKSISLIILGIIFFIATQYFERKCRTAQKPTAMFTKRQWSFIGLVVVLQLSQLSYEIISNEALLRNGKEITLELAPVDPRSMLQGDYVMLRYEIGEEIESKDLVTNQRVYVLAKEDQNGIYRKLKVLKNIDPKIYPTQEDEVLITGKYNGYSDIIFGIESYFVPEGTGLDLEREAKYANVVVSKNGNALLVSIK